MADKRLTSSWYVLHTRSRFENVVDEGLKKKALDSFLPKTLIQSKRSDRRKMIQVPLFPGYVFVKSDLSPSRYLDILRTVGVVKLVGTNAGPVAVPDETITSLQIMVATGSPIIAGDRFRKGDRVIVVNGPLSGVVGAFSRYGGKERVVVTVDALGQNAAVEIDEGDVERVNPSQ